MKKINWGIIGLGKIANRFANDIALSKNAILYAVASRDRDRAKAFSQKYNAAKIFDSYDELLKNPDIDIVYIATPHTFHFEQAMMSFKHGKHVLVEKPMGMNAEEVTAMIHEAKARNLFLMEGIWTRFIPATEKLIELLAQNIIGDLISLKADFGFKADFDPHNRIYNKSLGGGSLLDIGIYPIYLSLLVLGIPANIKAMARMAETEVDSYCAMLFDYQNSAKAMLESTTEADTPIEGYIYGTKGYIKLHRRFHHAKTISVHLSGKEEQIYNLDYKGEGLLYEIEEVNQCILNNQTESKKLPLSTSLNLIQIVDRVKEKIGLNYL